VQADITSLLGTWVNSNRGTEWIERFELTERDGSYRIRAQAAHPPHDWGEVTLWTCQDNIGELAFHAVFDLEDVEAVLAANTNKGLVVIAAFFRFKNGERLNYLCREFYYRQP
jgi:hypothetical protein